MYVKYQSELKVELLFFTTLRTVGSFNPGVSHLKGHKINLTRCETIEKRKKEFKQTFIWFMKFYIGEYYGIR